MCLFFKLGNESPSYSISTAFKILQGDEKGEKKDSSHCICKQISIKRLETILEIGMRELHTCLFIIATSLSYYPGKWPLLQVCYKP